MALPIPDEALKQHIADVGKTGAGKTYAAKAVVERLLDDARRVCIIDPTGVWYGLRSSANGKSPGYPVVVFGGDHADVPIAEKSAEKVAEIVASHNIPAIIDLSDFGMGEKHRFMEHFAGTLYKLNKAPLHLIIDEADEFAPQNPLPESRRMLNHIDRIVRRGRVKGFRVMLISQRPAVIHKNVLTQANTLIAMRLTAPQDRKAVEDWVKGNADADQAKEVLGSLARLSTGEGWVWAPEHGVLERVQFPLIKTFDSGRTPDDDDEILEPESLADVDVSELVSLLEEPEPEKPQATTTAAPGINEAERQKAYNDGYRLGYAEGKKDGHRAAQSSIAQHIVFVADGIVEKIDELRQLPESVAHADATPAPQPVVRNDSTTAKRPEVAADSDLSGPQRQFLHALAWWLAMGQQQPTRAQVAAICGWRVKSGHIKNVAGSLRSKGLIDYPTAGTISLTPEGREAAPPADMGVSLHDSIRGILSGPQRQVFDVLLQSPGAITRADLADRCGWEATSGHIKNVLGSMRSLDVIGYPASGEVELTGWIR